MIKLNKEQVLKLHTQLIEATGGSRGIRDERLYFAMDFETYLVKTIPVEQSINAVYMKAGNNEYQIWLEQGAELIGERES